MTRGIDSLYYDDRGNPFPSALEAKESDLKDGMMRLFQKMPVKNLLYSLVLDTGVRDELLSLLDEAGTYFDGRQESRIVSNQETSKESYQSGFRSRMPKIKQRLYTTDRNPDRMPWGTGMKLVIREPEEYEKYPEDIDDTAPVCLRCGSGTRRKHARFGSFYACEKECGYTVKL